MSFKNYKQIHLIVSIMALAFILDLFINNILIAKFEIFRNTRIPGNAFLIFSIFKFYDKFLWKWWGFSWLLKTPDVSGRFTGNVYYVFNNVPGSKACKVEISQTASKISVKSYFQKSGEDDTQSSSLVEDITLAPDGFYTLYILYRNEGGRKEKILDGHDGASILKFFPGKGSENSRLKGHYFTNRKIPTKGEMNLTFESKKLKGRY